MRDISVGPRGPPPLVCAPDLALPLAAREHGRRVYRPQCRGGIRRRQVSCSGTPSPSAPPVGTLSSTGTPSSLTTDTPETAVAALPLGPAAEEVPWPHVNHLRPQELPRGESTVSVAGDLVAHDGVSRDPNPSARARGKCGRHGEGCGSRTPAKAPKARSSSARLWIGDAFRTTWAARGDECGEELR